MVSRSFFLMICVFGMALCTTPVLAAKKSSAPGLSVKEIVSLKQVSSAHLSPKGDQIAYLLNVPRELFHETDGPSWTELHVINLDGKPLAAHSGKVNTRSVSWATDSSQVFFIDNHSETGRTGLYSLSPDSGKVADIFLANTGMHSIHPSPDGKTLAYLSNPAESEQDALLASQGFNAMVYDESSPNAQVWLLDLQTAESEMQNIPGSVSDLAWNADGTSYAVAVAATALEDDWELDRDIWVVDSKTSVVKHKLGTTGKLGSFKWSPDSQHIAYIGTEDVLDPNPGRLFVVSPEGGLKRELVPDYMGQVDDFFWRNSDEISYSGSRGAWTEFARASLSKATASQETPHTGPILRSVDGRPHMQVSVAVADTPQHPTEVFLLTSGDTPTRLTHSNPFLEQRSLARQEVIQLTARDGLELEAVLMHPLHQQSTPPTPLIIFAHGGPEAHYSNGWMSSYDEPVQALAAQGFTLAFPNYRGSTGRGVAFSKLSQGDSAGAEFDDLVDTKTFLVDAGLVLSDRTGIAGISYGGYAAMWAATALSKHFAAAVAFVGVSNQTSMFGTTDIPREMYQVHSRAWPWDNWQHMLERSPVFHVENANTPLLIMGGDADARFDPSQSLEMYQHMKLRTDTPVRLVIYPGEGHGNRRTAARFDYALRLQRWMNFYLNSKGSLSKDVLPPYKLQHFETDQNDKTANPESGRRF